MSTGLESPFSGFDARGALASGPSTEPRSMEAELREANEKLRAQLAAARLEIERERKQRADESSLPSEPAGTRAAESSVELAWQEEEVISTAQNIRTGKACRESQACDPTTFAKTISESPTCEFEAREDSIQDVDGGESCTSAVVDAEIDDGASELAPSRDIVSDESTTDDALVEEEQLAANAEDSDVAPCEDDDSIEAHIAAFMKRMGAGGAAAELTSQPARQRKRPVEAPPSPTIERRSVPRAAEEAPPPVPAAATPVIEATSVPATLERRACADVKDLAALRAVANMHTRLALHTHSKRQLVRTLVARLVGAGLCLVAGVIGLNVTERALSGVAMMVIVAGIYFMFLASEDAKRVNHYIKTRPAGSDNAADSRYGLDKIVAWVAALAEHGKKPRHKADGQQDES